MRIGDLQVNLSLSFNGVPIKVSAIYTDYEDDDNRPHSFQPRSHRDYYLDAMAATVEGLFGHSVDTHNTYALQPITDAKGNVAPLSQLTGLVHIENGMACRLVSLHSIITQACDTHLRLNFAEVVLASKALWPAYNRSAADYASRGEA